MAYKVPTSAIWPMKGVFQTFVSSMGGVTNRDKVFDLEADAEPIPEPDHDDEGFGPEPSQLGADDFTPDDDVDDGGW